MALSSKRSVERAHARKQAALSKYYKEYDRREAHDQMVRAGEESVLECLYNMRVAGRLPANIADMRAFAGIDVMPSNCRLPLCNLRFYGLVKSKKEGEEMLRWDLTAKGLEQCERKHEVKLAAARVKIKKATNYFTERIKRRLWHPDARLAKKMFEKAGQANAGGSE